MAWLNWQFAAEEADRGAIKRRECSAAQGTEKFRRHPVDRNLYVACFDGYGAKCCDATFGLSNASGAYVCSVSCRNRARYSDSCSDSAVIADLGQADRGREPRGCQRQYRHGGLCQGCPGWLHHLSADWRNHVAQSLCLFAHGLRSAGVDSGGAHRHARSGDCRQCIGAGEYGA